MEKVVFQKKNGKCEDFDISNETSIRLVVAKNKLGYLGLNNSDIVQAMVGQNDELSEQRIIDFLDFLDNLGFKKIELPGLQEMAEQIHLDDYLDKMLRGPKFRKRVFKQREEMRRQWEEQKKK